MSYARSAARAVMAHHRDDSATMRPGTNRPATWEQRMRGSVSTRADRAQPSRLSRRRGGRVLQVIQVDSHELSPSRGCEKPEAVQPRALGFDAGLEREGGGFISEREVKLAV